jgi:hypothetical protein
MNIEQSLIGALEMGKTHVKLYSEQKVLLSEAEGSE